MEPAVRLLGTVDDLSTTKVRSVPSEPRTTSQLPLEETTVPDIVDSVPAGDEDVADPDCWDEDGSCVPVVEPVWAASDPATPRLRAAPRRNAYRLLMLSSSSSSRPLPRQAVMAATEVPLVLEVVQDRSGRAQGRACAHVSESRELLPAGNAGRL